MTVKTSVTQELLGKACIHVTQKYTVLRDKWEIPWYTHFTMRKRCITIL